MFKIKEKNKEKIPINAKEIKTIEEFWNDIYKKITPYNIQKIIGDLVLKIIILLILFFVFTNLDYGRINKELKKGQIGNASDIIVKSTFGNEVTAYAIVKAIDEKGAIYLEWESLEGIIDDIKEVPEIISNRKDFQVIVGERHKITLKKSLFGYKPLKIKLDE